MTPKNLSIRVPTAWSNGPNNTWTRDELIIVDRISCVSGKSPRDSNGKLILRANACNITKHFESGELCTISYNNLRGKQSSLGYFPSPSVLTDDLKDAATRAFYDEASILSVNVAEMLATRRETISMIASTARRLANSYKALRRGDPREACSILGCQYRRPRRNTPSAQWLEYVYGWKPLVSDIYTLIAEPETPPSIVVSKTRKMVNGNYTYISSRSSDYEWYLYATGALSASVNVRANLRLKNSLAGATKYGIDNPALLAWELLPYSFIVDWFLPVGNYLNCLDATLGCSFRDGFTAEKNRSEIRLTRLGVKESGNFRYQYSVGGLAVLETYTRVRELDFPAVSLPQPKNPLSAQHVANALALLTQAFSKR